MDSNTFKRTQALDQLNDLSNAVHNGARVIENLRLVKERLPSGWDDVVSDVDQLIIDAQKLNSHLADGVATQAKQLLLMAEETTNG